MPSQYASRLPRPDVISKEAAFSLRGLGRERAFATLSIILLALGIGFTSAVFTLLWQAIYAQLPIPDPARVFAFRSNVTHYGRSESDAMAETFSLPTYRYLASAFKEGGIVARHGEFVNMQTPGGSQHVLVDFVSGNFFKILGVKALVGTTFEARNDSLSDDRFAVVLSYDFWQQAYGGDPSAWNSMIRVNGVPFRIIGVSPPGFKGLVGGQAPKLFLPLSAYTDLNPGWPGATDWSVRWVNPFVRLPAGLTQAVAEAQLQPIYRAAVRQEVTSESAHATPDYLKELAHEYLSLLPASRGADAALSDWREPLRILQWMTIAVLMLAVLNVAGLMLVRAVKQRREMLIRYAVGASRMAVMRLHFIQTMALALAGGLVGLWVARVGSRLLAHLAGLDTRDALVYQPHGWTLALHWSMAVLAGLLAGLTPAWQAARIDIAGGLNEGSFTHSASRSQTFWRRSLAAGQIALSLVLAIAAGLFAESLHKVVSVPVGFAAAHLSVFSIDPKLANSSMEGTELLWARLQQRLSQSPGVGNVSYGTGGPFPSDADSVVVIPGTPPDAGRHQNGLRSLIGPDYFKTFGIPLVGGREFDGRDRANTPNVVIINQRLAHKLFGAANPVGQTVSMFNGLDPNWLATVVGVAADSRQSWKRAAGSLIYTPAQQAKSAAAMNYYVRTIGPAISEETIRKIVRAEAPGIAPYDITTMQDRMAEFAATERALAILVSAFAGLALAIAAVGIYGVVAYGSSLRTAEFGIRVSVGASPAQIFKLVLLEALQILCAGFLLAVPLGYFGATLVRHRLNALTLVEPSIYAGAVLLLAVCAFAAALIPARRATRLSVHGALRHS